MNNYRLIAVQVLLAVCAIVCAVTVLYIKHNASAGVGAFGDEDCSNVTLGDLAEKLSGGVVSGR